MGLTFKENSPDLRNTGVANLVTAFQDYDCNVDVYDPWVDSVEAKQECGIEPITQPVQGKYDAILLAVAHDEFKNLSPAEIELLERKIM